MKCSRDPERSNGKLFVKCWVFCNFVAKVYFVLGKRIPIWLRALQRRLYFRKARSNVGIFLISCLECYIIFIKLPRSNCEEICFRFIFARSHEMHWLDHIMGYIWCHGILHLYMNLCICLRVMSWFDFVGNKYMNVGVQVTHEITMKWLVELHENGIGVIWSLMIHKLTFYWVDT
jgi:hypothetical protein